MTDDEAVASMENSLLLGRWFEDLNTTEGREKLLRWAFEYLRRHSSKRHIPRINQDRVTQLLTHVKGCYTHEKSAQLVQGELDRINASQAPSRPGDFFEGMPPLEWIEEQKIGDVMEEALGGKRLTMEEQISRDIDLEILGELFKL